MSVVQFHLLLNHFPTIGFAAVCALFAMALLRKNEDLNQASLIGFFLIALITIPVYLSGSAAEFVVRDQPGVSADVIAAHQDAAMLALLFMQIAGFVAWLALWRFQRWAVPALVVLSIVTFGLMVRAANIGGEIRHPEILAEGVAASESSWPQAAAMGAALVVNHPWVWPICEIFHFVGLCLLFGITTLVNLRMLGVIKGVDVADINQLLPLAAIGLAMNMITGMLFFLAAPDQYTQNSAFAWKMGAMLIGGLTLLYPIASNEVRALKRDAGASIVSKIVAVASISLWIAVIFLGRFLPYIGSE